MAPLKHIINGLLVAYSSLVISQTNPASFFYQEGVKAAHLNKYSVADSLFTLSLNIQPHPDAYFNRAAIRLRLGNQKGYCEDLACASAIGDAESLSAFCLKCGRADTVRSTAGVLQSWQARYTVNYRCNFFSSDLMGRYNSKNKLLGFGWDEPPRFVNSIVRDSTGKDSTARVDEIAEFPGGGFLEMGKFIQLNLTYPAEALETGLSGKVYLRITVNCFGYIENVKVIKGIAECKPCDYEALRVLSIMPRWNPAKVKGKNVSVFMEIPVAYLVR